MAYPNGEIPTHLLKSVPALNNQRALLLPEVADSWLTVVAEVERTHGWTPIVTSAGDGFRSKARQVAVFNERYDPQRSSRGPFGDVRHWDSDGNGTKERYARMRGAAAAVPGTSNHGRGTTVDVSRLGAFTSLRYRQFKTVAQRHGWSNTEGASVGEPWHWTKIGANLVPIDTNAGTGVGTRVLRLTNPHQLGEDVRAWQITLVALGHPVAPDADFGPATDTATKAFQRSANLIPDGDVGPGTRTAAAARLRPVKQRNIPETIATQRAVNLVADSYWGDDTEYRVNLVRAAINNNFPAGVAEAQRTVGATPDGRWGPRSAAALTQTIRELQRAWGVTPDGDWGPKTDAACARARSRNFKAW